MADITMCPGTFCPHKETCYRYTAKMNEYRQAYFLSPPIKDGKCDMYWGENQMIPEEKHRCEAPHEAKDYLYGCAIWVCYENELDELLVENGEYGSQVNYCPYCGYESKTKIK